MASLTQWAWVWVNSGSWWWTGRPGVLRFMGSQRVGHDWVTELNWTEHILNATSGGPSSEGYLWTPIRNCHFRAQFSLEWGPTLGLVWSDVLGCLIWSRIGRGGEGAKRMLLLLSNATLLLLLFSHSVMSNTWDPMGCSTPRFPVLHHLQEFVQTHVHWVSDAIQPSHPVTPFSYLQSFPASGSFPMSWLFTSGGQSIGVLASASVFPMSIQGRFTLELTGLVSLLPKGLSRVFSSTTVWKHQCHGKWQMMITTISWTIINANYHCLAFMCRHTYFMHIF